MQTRIAVVLIALTVGVAPPARGMSVAPSLPPGMEVREDVAYGPHALQRLDVYLQPGAGPYPVVVFVHGGGHVRGDKAGGGLELLLPFAARAGYSVVSINYRLAPEFRHPAQVEDARLAVRWLRANAARFRIDPGRLAVAGASAGGHIVTFLAFTPCAGTPGAADAVMRQSCRPSTVINFFGTTDLRERTDRLLAALLGPDPTPDVKAAASPITHVSPDDPPTLSLHGTADRLVPYAQSVALHRALAEAGIPNRLITVARGGHGVDWLTHPQAASWQGALIRWLDAYLKP